MSLFHLLLLLLLLLPLAPAPSAAGEERSLMVDASAYNSVPRQTQGDPSVGAWGDRLQPGMKAIAVSRDLLKMGLTRGSLVKIEGLSGRYRVLDKMGRRWKRKIDIYMGNDVGAARRFGVCSVIIRWVDATGGLPAAAE